LSERGQNIVVRAADDGFRITPELNSFKLEALKLTQWTSKGIPSRAAR
jgi:hypothetical protein